MLDLSRFEGQKQYEELVAEIKKLRDVGSRLAEVSQMVAAETEPIDPNCVKCEHLDQKKAREALDAWRAL
jgi:DNA-binding transcriptional MerR regulator